MLVSPAPCQRSEERKKDVPLSSFPWPRAKVGHSWARGEAATSIAAGPSGRRFPESSAKAGQGWCRADGSCMTGLALLWGLPASPQFPPKLQRGWEKREERSSWREAKELLVGGWIP